MLRTEALKGFKSLHSFEMHGRQFDAKHKDCRKPHQDVNLALLCYVGRTDNMGGALLCASAKFLSLGAPIKSNATRYNGSAINSNFT